MVAHHYGAIEMTDTEIARGNNPAAVALAESIKPVGPPRSPSCSNSCRTCDSAVTRPSGDR